MTLYEINQAILDCLTVNIETGEADINEEALERLTIVRQDKLENIALWTKNLAADAAALAAEVKALAERKKAAEAKIERLRAILERELGGETFSTPRVAITYRKSTATIIDAEGDVPPAYLRVKTEPDKTAIKAALASGATVPGARLEEKINMQIK